jgi:Holliday junction DNA helicase RuvB
MSVRPNSLDEVVGQKKAKTILKTFVDASLKTGDLCPSILTISASGQGKSTLAYTFADSLGKGIHNVNAASVKNQKELFDIFRKVKYGDVVFIDEIHALSTKVSESLYTVLEDFCYFNGGRKVEVNKFVALAATTNIGDVPIPLKNRFQFIIELEKYSLEELTDICHLVCTKKGFKLNKDIAMTIAKTAKGVPRTISNRTIWIYNYLMANNLKSVSKDKLLEIIALQGVDENGLDNKDIKYISSIGYDVVSLRELSAKLNVEPSEITNIIEPYLIEQDLVRITKRGRELTMAGVELFESKTTSEKILSYA